MDVTATEATIPKSEISKEQHSINPDEIMNDLAIDSEMIEKILLMFREQFSSVKGFYSLKETSKKKFPSQPDRNYKTIQIHRKGSGSWVVSCCDANSSDIYLYDCNLQFNKWERPKVWKDLQIQLVKFYAFHDFLNLKLPMLPVLPYSKSSSMYAVAYAIELCLDKDAKMAKFVESEMRSHLMECLELNKLSSFPLETLEETPIVNSYTVPLVCICRMPRWHKRYLLMCDKCYKIFHEICLPKNERKTAYNRWRCPTCKAKSVCILFGNDEIQ